MRAFFHENQFLHAPQQFMRAGRLCASTDVPERAQALLSAVERLNLERITPPEMGLAPALRVHSPEYINFLSGCYENWIDIRNAGPEVLPNLAPYWGVHPGERRPPCRSTSIVAQAGYYLGDLAVPLAENSWQAILASSHTAAHAADYVAMSGSSAYALCRPSGHHARTDRASGFCYVNNAAIGASALAEKYGRVAIIDVDAHHGDGTQEIFYDSGSVLTVSIHVDPSVYFPFYTGYEDELGVGEGQGANLNISLAAGSGDTAFCAAILKGLDSIRDFDAQALVVALGFDGHVEDPIGMLKISADGYGQAGELIAGCNLPTLIVQEGGYGVSALGDCLGRFLHPFLQKR